ncbi:hypothetical protein DAEQUDRAFT_733305 [Daedalea quercina L-15889]|uniref:L domain-like protein n=1 Tax=Daedalea quercina L-15889 TaxID=1314783 RepID=A0A165L3W5_9APHY|nr:hypothetical protein DAEQUDRAFT_733305 [Daedalea quercina L-15889]
MDPYAASAHGTWKPPRREKKPFSRSASATSAYSTSTVLSDDTADGNLARSLNRSTDEDDLHLDDEFTAPHAARYSSMMESEEEIWDMVIARAIETANGEIFLQNSPLLSRPLTYIPPSISDLAGLVVLPNSSTALAAKPIAAFPTHRPFLRSATVPVSSPRSGPLFDDNKPRKSLQKAGSTVLVRTATSAMLPDPASTGSKSEIRLFLSNNRIKSLPLELFQLTGLTVLALRSNRISVLPSQIAQLTSLRELNIPTNKLRWLPSEMLGMHPMRLCVTNNPWIRPPPPDEDPELAPPSTQLRRARPTRASEPTRTHVSPTTVHFSIPPLTELCLRLLLSPVPGTDTEGTRRPDTVLEAYYALPFSGTDRTLPPTLLHTLRACLPSAVAKPAAQPSPSKKPHCAPHAGLSSTPQDADEEPPPSIGVCPSPVHRALDGGWVGGRVPVFVRHAEERLTWEREVVGTDVKAECGGAGVPVRWRGCWKGCLDFLDPGQDEPQAGSEDGAMDVDEDGDVDVLLLEVGGLREPDGDNDARVRIVQFAGGPISGFDDFE